MKTFSTLKNEIKPKYELKDSLRNEIYSLIENSISIKISNEDSLDKDIIINGKEELVEKIKNLIDDVRIKERTMTLETVKANVYRNFDQKWLNEQINGLTKIKIGSNFVLKENIGNAPVADEYKGEILNYFVKKLNEIGKIGEFEFDHDPSDGIFKFVNKNENIVVKATPFYNDDKGIPVEVCDDKKNDTHYFVQQRNFNIEEILFIKYFEIMEKFLIDDFDNWINKIHNANEVDDDGYHISDNNPVDFEERQTFPTFGHPLSQSK